METFVIAEGFAVLLVGFVSVGLLRAYGELRLDLQHLQEDPVRKQPPERGEGTAAVPISGNDLDRQPRTLAFGMGRPDTLLAFLSSGCLVCHNFWRDLREGTVPSIPGIERIVIVTKGFHEESPSKLVKLGPSEAQALVISSSEAWEDYEIPGAPYFVYIDGANGTIAGEGSASGWEQIAALIVDAGADADSIRQLSDRVSAEDAALEAAGIGPGHPSLHDPAYEDGQSRNESE